MFTKAQTRAPPYILFKSLFLAIGWSYLQDLSHTFLKRLKRPNIKIVYFFYRISNHKNFIPKCLDNALTDFARVPSAKKYCAEVK